MITMIEGSRAFLLGLLVLLAGCAGDRGAVDGSPDLMQAGIALEVTCEDTVDAVYANPGAVTGQKGAILRCAHDRDLLVGELQAALDADTFTSRAVTSGAHIYRVLFETERGTATPTPGYSSALLLLPDSPRAAQLPVVVANHGTRSEAAACTASKLDPIDATVNPDFRRLVYGLVGYGYAVIAPDGAGYANYGAAANPPAGFLHANDEGKSALDGARALRNLIPSSLTDQVVMVGHSQGGHTTLSALALSDTYGAGGTLSAVALYSPLWIAMRAWGTLLAIPGAFPTSTAADINSFSIYYHYTAGELLDGPGHGVDAFATSRQAAVKTMIDTTCGDGLYTQLRALGADASQFFDPALINAVGQTAAGFQPSCPTDPTANALCTKWMQRYAADRPHISGHAATVPIFLAWGSGDTVIPYDRATCGIDRLRADGANLQTLCVEPGVSHGDILGAKADVVGDWIAQQTLGGPAPAACPSGTIMDPMGQPATCSTIPPNSGP